MTHPLKGRPTREPSGKTSQHASPLALTVLQAAIDQGITRDVLATKTGVSTILFWYWRRGRSPRLVDLEAAAKVVGLKVVLVKDD